LFLKYGATEEVFSNPFKVIILEYNFRKSCCPSTSRRTTPNERPAIRVHNSNTGNDPKTTDDSIAAGSSDDLFIEKTDFATVSTGR
jgi:hypothetical protein